MTNNQRRRIRVGARGSQLSVAQANWVINRLLDNHPDIIIEFVTIRTGGDRDQNTALSSLGGTGVFVKELEKALSKMEIDLAVHSAKDLPSSLPDEFTIAAVPPRASVEDALISVGKMSLGQLPANARLATGSPRRRAQVRRIRSDLEFVEVRGNLDTRLQKLVEGHFEATILARAGLKRLDIEGRISQILPADKFIPAPGQGALVVEARSEDHAAIEICEKIDSPRDRSAIMAERMLLSTLQVGCSVPVGGWARWVSRDELRLDAVVLDHSGKTAIEASGASTVIEQSADLGQKVAEELLNKGAKELLDNGK